MRALSLFSGIGGIDLAATVCGFEAVAFCEIDPFCSAVLQTHWPEAPIYADVKEVSYERLRRDGLLPIDCIYGGPPCQPASLAGRRRGKLDVRWLWPEFLRVVGEVRPRWCVAENPVGILSIDAGRAWGDILGSLVEMGYCCGWGVWGACDVGAPHRRERVFLLGYLPDATMADSFGYRQWIGPDQPERQSARGSAPDVGLDGAQSILADATGQGYSHRFSGGLKAHPAASSAGLESQSQRCGAMADPASGQRQQWAQAENGREQVSGGWNVWPDPGGCSETLADAAFREDRGKGERGLSSDVASNGAVLADLKGGQCQWGRSAWTGQPRFANDGDALADASGTGLEKRAGVARNSRKERSSSLRAGESERGTEGSPIVLPECRVGGGVDGFPAFVEHPRFPAGPGQPPATWEPPRTIPRGIDPYRRKRLHALGNAVVPAQIVPLFRAIAEVEAHLLGRKTPCLEQERNGEAWQRHP